MKKIFSGIENLNDESLDKLVELDSHGLLLAPGETAERFKQRLLTLKQHLEEIRSELDEKGSLPLFATITLERKRRIPNAILAEAAEIDRTRYAFSIDWVPGFFLSKSLGFLWGGCAISFPEDHLSIFLIRASFAEKKKWLMYRRDELLAHELCHVARMPIGDRSFEELFAYRLSPSRLRRSFGNCFQYTWDAVLFIAPFFILVAAQALRFSLDEPAWLPIEPFWCLVPLYPLFLLCRNQWLKGKFDKAKSNLELAGVEKPLPVLFRMTKKEIFEFANFAGEVDLRVIQTHLTAKTNEDLRWKVIAKRFLGGE
ncbi:MAG: hypothetical protein GXP32_08765 [Kiritimatiellaeota bacterium]|nr:hypothetical protein [Kiritimatiellota bacterium]